VTSRLRLFALIAASAVALCGCGSAGSEQPRAVKPSRSAAATPADEAPLVAAAFNGYKAAALAGDGPAAVQHLADTAYVFYDEARESALTASADELRRQPVSTQLTVLFMRGSLDADLLREGSPEELVAAAIDAGLVGEAGLNRLELGDISVTGDKAKASVLVASKAAHLEMSFIRQGGRWTLDLLPLIRLSDAAFEEAARQQGLTIDQLVDSTLAQKYGNEQAARLREPLGR
jgi:hypothetical protein